MRPRASVLEARARLDRQGLGRLGVVLPDWLLSGQGAADLRLDLPDGAPGRLSARSDLDGISLAIPALGWQLGGATTGTLEVEACWDPRPKSRRSPSKGRVCR
jgi:hypothetical protein